MRPVPVTLEKWVWNEADYERMGWHDCYVHAVALLPDDFALWFDIDYILQWVDPVPPTAHYTFWVAPATLVFEMVWDLKIEVDAQSPAFNLIALDRADEQPSRDGKARNWLWTLDGLEGSISFRASGYTQYFRRRPLHIEGHVLTLAERGGLSFDRTPLPGNGT